MAVIFGTVTRYPDGEREDSGDRLAIVAAAYGLLQRGDVVEDETRRKTWRVVSCRLATNTETGGRSMTLVLED